MSLKMPPIGKVGPLLAVAATMLVMETTLPRGAQAEEQEEAARGWCGEEQQWDGWWHDFDLLQPAGHECYDGSPNSWHMNVQSGKCSTYHTASTGCIF
jgi:hypothetical protein